MEFMTRRFYLVWESLSCINIPVVLLKEQKKCWWRVSNLKIIIKLMKLQTKNHFNQRSPGLCSLAASTQGRHPPRISGAVGSPAWRSASRWGWSPPTPAPPSPWRARAPGDWWSSQDLRCISNEILTCFPVFEAYVYKWPYGKHVRCACTSIILEDLHSTKCAFRDKWRHEKLGEASIYGWKRQTARQILLLIAKTSSITEVGPEVSI